METATTDVNAALARLRRTLGTTRRVGRSQATSVTTLVAGGVRAETREADWVIAADLPGGLGGGASAPTPSTLLRAALGTCLAIGYQLRATERAITLRGLRVTVTTASDVRGMLDPDADVPAGFLELCAHVEIDGDAPPAELEHLIEAADRLSPVLDVLRHPVTRTITVGPVT